MIVVDTSALIAILTNEREAELFARQIANAERCLLCAVNYLEASLVMVGRFSPAASSPLDDLIREAMIEIVPFDADLAQRGRAAFIRFGKGRHPAALNFGDCAAYALAHATGFPLLFKGHDFAQTDLTSAAAR